MAVGTASSRSTLSNGSTNTQASMQNVKSTMEKRGKATAAAAVVVK